MAIIIAVALVLLVGFGATIQEWQNHKARQARDRLRARVYGNHPAGTGRVDTKPVSL